jgi:hypothetical protein
VARTRLTAYLMVITEEILRNGEMGNPQPSPSMPDLLIAITPSRSTTVNIAL